MVRGFCGQIGNQSGSRGMKTELDSGEILPEATVIRGSVSDSLQLRAGESLKLGGNTDVYSP